MAVACAWQIEAIRLWHEATVVLSLPSQQLLRSIASFSVLRASSNISRFPCEDASNVNVCAAKPYCVWARWMLSASSSRAFATVHLLLSPLALSPSALLVILDLSGTRIEGAVVNGRLSKAQEDKAMHGMMPWLFSKCNEFGIIQQPDLEAK